MKKLFIGGIAYSTKEDTLRDAFAQAGVVVSATIVTDRETGRSKGFGFVEMETEDDAQKAIDMWNGKELDGRVIAVSIARPKTEGGDRRPARRF